jgi:hypothetical protein
MAEDNWAHRSAGMRCFTCVYFVPKLRPDNMVADLGRCRRHAPTMNGFVPVFQSDWCGDHKLDEAKTQAGRGKDVSMTDADHSEQELQKKGLTAPRVTPDDIEAAIRSVTYWQPAGTTVTVALVEMTNGFYVVGKAAAVFLANFDKEIGERVALQDAKRQMWALLGYALRDSLASE